MYRDIKLVPLAEPLPPDEAEIRRETEKAEHEFTLPPELLAPPVPVTPEAEEAEEVAETADEDI
jgi:hypothetical protein